jgi:hypothetical protein
MASNATREAVVKLGGRSTIDPPVITGRRTAGLSGCTAMKTLILKHA